MSRVTKGAAVFVAVVFGAACAAAAPMSVDATGCLQALKSAPAENCPTKGSLALEIVNTCAFPVRMQVCVRGSNHLYASCENRASLSPMEHVSRSTCNSDGAYTFWGCSKFSAQSGNCGGDDLVGKASNVGEK
jgi:hypothetical protein